jgi:hypothetical protein
MWNDTTHLNSGMFQCVKKTFYAEKNISKDIVQVIWDYGRAKPKTIERIQDLVNKGFEVWMAPGRRPEDVKDWREAVIEHGGTGLLMTMWRPTHSSNRERFLNAIKEVGPIYSSKEPIKEGLRKEPAEKSKEKPGKIEKAEKPKRVIKEVKTPILAPNYLKEPLKQPDYLLPAECYVKNWMVLGPFRFEREKYNGRYQQDATDDSSFVGVSEDMLAAKEEGTKEYGAEWKKYVIGKDVMFPQVIDMGSLYGELEYAVAYLVANVYSPGDVENCRMYFGSDDYIKVWLNGELIHTYKDYTRSTVQDDDKVENVTLGKGWNTLVVKCVNIRSNWDFLARFANEKDEPVITSVSK